jgi:small-conductance mechanosensitive channel
VREALIAVGRAHPNALKEPAPSVFFDKFGESSLDFELVVWSSEMSHRPRRFKSDLNFAIEKKFRELGIEIPFPQRDVYIKSGKIDVASHPAARGAIGRRTRRASDHLFRWKLTARFRFAAEPER